MKYMQKTLLVSIVVLGCLSTAFSQKMTAEDVIGKHLNSIGAESIRAGAKSLMVVGTGSQKFTSTADAPVEGRIVFASEQTKMFLGMNMNSTQYPGQQFKFDGKKHDVAITTQSGRDFLGNFVQDNASLLKAGIFGGALSTNWLMANVSSDKGKLSMAGTSKVNGRDAYVIEFLPKGGSDVSIKLYFDSESFQHVRTEYRRMTSAPQGVIGRGLSPAVTGDNSGRQSETRLVVTEDYGDFKSKVGLMMPHSYRLKYSRYGNQGTVECEWNFALTEFIVNPKLDPATFAITGNEKSDD